MRIRALAVAVTVVAGLMAVAGPAFAANRNRDDSIVPGSYIVVLDDSVQSVSKQLAEQERRDGFRARHVYRSALKGYSAKLTPAQVRDLASDPQVASIEPNRIVHMADTLAGGETVPTGIARIGAASTSTGWANPASSAAVAVIDTGVDVDHPDLDVGSGANCVSSGAAPIDDNGHGTHVSGTIAATNSGSGVVGVAPGTRIVPVKVLNSRGSGTWAQIICGINWVAAHASSDGIAVANMSLGGLGSSSDNGACGATSALHQAICNATTAGVRFAVAAGNDAWPYPDSSLPDVPAAYDEVMTVTAYGDSNGLAGGGGAAPSCRSGEADDRYASFSNWSNNTTDNAHTIAAPGVCIYSTWLGTAASYNTISGTSMATPHVAGAAALCVGTAAGGPGACSGDTNAASLVSKLDSTDSSLGFSGDPFRPVSGRYYGYTLVAGAPSTAPVPAGFTLSASPPSRSITRGQSTTYAVTINRDAGFSSSVSFSVSGLPNRSSGTFSPSSTTGTSSTLTVSTASKTVRGTRTVTITGTGGGQSRTVQVTLTVG
jgi:subtilisin